MPEIGSLQTQDPQDVLTWEFDWDVTGNSWLGTDTISAALVTVDPGITIDSQSYTDTSVFVTLSGGTVGAKYKVNCHITTAVSGEESDKSFYLMVEEN